jgi:aldehyde dehydrogenase (NAD+)
MKEQDYNIRTMLKNLGIKDINSGASTGAKWIKCQGDITSSISPIDGKEIAKVQNASIEEYESVVQKAQEAFNIWRKMPAPARGEIVRQIGLASWYACNS